MKYVTFNKTTKLWNSFENSINDYMRENFICIEFDETQYVPLECYNFTLDENDNLVVTLNKDKEAARLQRIKDNKITEVKEYYDNDFVFREFTIIRKEERINTVNISTIRNWFFERYLIDAGHIFLFYIADSTDYVEFDFVEVRSISDKMAFEKDIMQKNKRIAEKEINQLTIENEVDKYPYATVLNTDLDKQIILS